MDRSLTMELVRVTEAAAVSSARWMGFGKKDEADQAATTAMRKVFDTIPMKGTVVIGEGEMDEAPMLYIGEQLGSGSRPRWMWPSIPWRGPTSWRRGCGTPFPSWRSPTGAICCTPPTCTWRSWPWVPAPAGQVDLNAPVEDNLKSVARALGKDMDDLVVVILDRPRHAELIEEVRRCGARIKLIPDGDVAAAVNTGFPDTGVDILYGIGGAPEGVLAAVALKCLGGEIQGRLVPENEEQWSRCREMGIDDPQRVLFMDDLVKGDDAIFAATGVTDGELLRGVRYRGDLATTHSLVMRAKTGTVRFIEGTHRLKKKPNLVLE